MYKSEKKRKAKERKHKKLTAKQKKAREKAQFKANVRVLKAAEEAAILERATGQVNACNTAVGRGFALPAGKDMEVPANPALQTFETSSMRVVHFRSQFGLHTKYLPPIGHSPSRDDAIDRIRAVEETSTTNPVIEIMEKFDRQNPNATQNRRFDNSTTPADLATNQLSKPAALAPIVRRNTRPSPLPYSDAINAMNKALEVKDTDGARPLQPIKRCPGQLRLSEGDSEAAAYQSALFASEDDDEPSQGAQCAGTATNPPGDQPHAPQTPGAMVPAAPSTAKPRFVRRRARVRMPTTEEQARLVELMQASQVTPQAPSTVKSDSHGRRRRPARKPT